MKKALSVLLILVFVSTAFTSVVAHPMFEGDTFALNNIEVKSGSTYSMGYYKVIDVYPSGKKIIRGTSSINSELPPRQEPKGYSHPLSSDYIWFSGQLGTFVYLGQNNEGYDSVLYEFNGSTLLNNKTWNLELGKAGYGAAINYGGDCFESFIVPDYSNNPILIDRFTGEKILDFSSYGVTGEIISVQVGNFDSDYSSEVVFLRNDSGVQLIILDDWKNNFFNLATINLYDYLQDYTSNGAILKTSTPSIYVHDVDNDGKDEILATVTIIVTILTQEGYIQVSKCLGFIFDDGEQNFNLITEFENKFFTLDTEEIFFSRIVAGDFDGDGEVEIIVAYGALTYYQFNGTTNSVDFLNILNFTSSFGYYPFVIRPELRVADLDLDYRDELIVVDVGQSRYRLFCLKFNSTYFVSTRDIVFEQIPFYNLKANLGVGDLDNDVYPEILLALFTSNLRIITIYDDVLNNFVKADEKGYSPRYIRSMKPIVIQISLNGRVLLKYTGLHNKTAPMPYIIAAIAAPPTIKGILQNHAGSSTLFGTAVTRAVSETNGYIVRVGTTLSFEKGDLFKVVNIRASVTISKEFEKTKTVTEVVQECREFVTDYTNNYVVFESVTYDNYYYEIVLHPIKEYEGQIMAISVPNKVAVYKWTVSYFNSHNGDAPDIGSETFKHKIGEVWTYPTKEDMEWIQNAYKDKGFWRTQQTMTVGEGAGINSIEIDLSYEETTEETTTYGVEFELGFSIAGVGLSVSLGLGMKYAYAVTVGNSTKYRGDVGDIASSYYDKYMYSFGLFVYNLYRNDTNAAYQVINYWIEDYNGPKSVPSNLYSYVSDIPALVNTIDTISYKLNIDPNITTALLIFALPIGIGVITYKGYAIVRGKKRKKKSVKRRKKK